MAGRLIQVDADTGGVLSTFSIGTEPTGVAVGAGGVWAASYPSDVLWKVDPKSGVVSTTPGHHPSAVALAATKRAVYPVFDSDEGMELIRQDPNVPVAHVVLNNRKGVANLGDATQVATGPGGVWGIGSDTLYQVKPSSGYFAQAVHLVKIPSIEDEEHVRDQLSGLAVGAHTVWVIGDVGDQRLWRIDTSQLVPRATPLGFDPADVAVGFGHVWVTGQITNKLYKIDRSTGQVVRAFSVGREPMGVAVGAGAVWVANKIDGTISKVDPRTGERVTIPVDESPTEVSVGDGSVWVVGDAS